jgi:hypothetical protein
MPDKTSKKIFTMAQFLQFRGDGSAEVADVCCSEVRKPGKLRVVPHTFVWVQLWSVRGKSMSSDMAIAGQVLPHVSRMVMDVDPVPDDFERPLDLTTEEAKEPDYIFRVGIHVVVEELKVEAQAMPLGAECNGADRRDPVMTVPALLDRGLSPRRKCSPHQGCEHEAGFVEEN